MKMFFFLVLLCCLTTELQCQSECWDLILQKRFNEAIEVGEAYVQKFPRGATENLAHAYLFVGRYNDAEKIYLNNIGTCRTTSGGLWESVVISDFRELASSGITNNYVSIIRQKIISELRSRITKDRPISITRNIAIKAIANQRFLSVSSRKGAYSWMNGLTKSTLYTSPETLLASQSQIGDREKFEIQRFAGDPSKPDRLNRILIIFRNYENNGEYYLAIQNKTIEKVFVLPNYSDSQDMALLREGSMASFEMIPVNRTQFQLKSFSNSEYLQVLLQNEKNSPLTMHSNPKDGIFEFIDAETGKALEHGLDIRKKYKSGDTFMGIAPFAEYKLIGRGYSEDGKYTDDIHGSVKQLGREKSTKTSLEIIECEKQIDAKLNISALKAFAEGGASYSENSKYLFAISQQIDSSEVFESTPQKGLLTNPNTKICISKVFYGWAAVNVIQSNSSSIKAEISSNIKKIGINADFKEYRADAKFESILLGFGAKSINASELTSYDQAKRKFTPTKIPVPILVEYTVLEPFDIRELE